VTALRQGLNATDIQGMALRGYNMPFARYLFLEITEHEKGRVLIDRLLPQITTGRALGRWGKPPFSGQQSHLRIRASRS